MLTIANKNALFNLKLMIIAGIMDKIHVESVESYANFISKWVAISTGAPIAMPRSTLIL